MFLVLTSPNSNYSFSADTWATFTTSSQSIGCIQGGCGRPRVAERGISCSLGPLVFLLRAIQVPSSDRISAHFALASYRSARAQWREGDVLEGFRSFGVGLRVARLPLGYFAARRLLPPRHYQYLKKVGRAWEARDAVSDRKKPAVASEAREQRTATAQWLTTNGRGGCSHTPRARGARAKVVTVTAQAVGRPRLERLRVGVRTLRFILRLVLDAAPLEISGTFALTLGIGAFTAGQLLVGRELVQVLTDSDGGSLRQILPGLIALCLLLIATMLSSTAVLELRIPLYELLHRRAMRQVLEAAAAAELDAFEDPKFHDQIQRGRENSEIYAWQIIENLVSFLLAFFSTMAVMAVLLDSAPLLLPVAALGGFVPIAVVALLQSRAF